MNVHVNWTAFLVGVVAVALLASVAAIALALIFLVQR